MTYTIDITNRMKKDIKLLKRIMKKLFKALLLPITITILIACTDTDSTIGIEHQNQLTVAKVQREIKEGMPSAKVVEVLGTPNMITSGEEHEEVWIYDKVYTQTVRSSSTGMATLVLIGTESNSSSTVTSQKNLTIIIKFDKNSRVKSFSYRSSSF